jgi:hypothetical protein
MSRLSRITVAVTAAGVARQALVLSGIVRSARFLRQDQNTRPPSAGGAGARRLFIAVPVLREAAILPETVAHFQALACGHAATVVIITTEREAGEATRHAAAGDTVAAARELAREGKCVHLHYPGPQGLKADQLNHAAVCCAAMLPDGVPSSQAFLACYDADSRPPLDSLARFTRAIADHPGADVFHQSSRFESRSRQQPAAGLLRRIRAAICDAGALRANRFVLGFELPRLLNRSGQVSAVKRALCSGVYAHVTGHGLCARLSLLADEPVVVAHSGGCLLLPAIAREVGARHLVWLAGYVPDPAGGQSFAGEIKASGAEMFGPEWRSLTEPPTADPVVAAYFLFHDCDLETLPWAVSTLRLFFPVGAYQEAGQPAEPVAPSTYVLPRGDRTFWPQSMRAAARERLGVDPVEIDGGGHCPHV